MATEEVSGCDRRAELIDFLNALIGHIDRPDADHLGSTAGAPQRPSGERASELDPRRCRTFAFFSFQA